MLPHVITKIGHHPSLPWYPAVVVYYHGGGLGVLGGVSEVDAFLAKRLAAKCNI